jgi:hypothetical protein
MQNDIQNPVRKFRAVPFAAALLCFFLPFVQVSCTMQRSMGFPFSGVQMVTGTEIQAPDFGGGRGKTEKLPPSPQAIFVLLCSLAALGLSLAPGRAGSLFAAIAGAAGFLVMLLLKAGLDQDVLKQGQGLLVVEYRIGFIAICICLLAGAAMNGYAFRQSREAITT